MTKVGVRAITRAAVLVAGMGKIGPMYLIATERMIERTKTLRTRPALVSKRSLESCFMKENTD
jgi:hypothetical protein